MKKCSTCLEFKPLSEFSAKKRTLSNGVEKVSPLSSCKSCRNEKRRLKYQEEKNICIRYIYKFIDINGNVIYIGKTNNLKTRISNHLSTKGHLPKKCYKEIYKIEFLIVSSDVLMDIKELYYINLYKPKFNSIHKYNSPSFIISDFTNDKWVNYDDFDSDEINYIKQLKSSQEDYDIVSIRSIFKRKRGKRYLVYIEYIDSNKKIIQKKKGSFKSIYDADKLINSLKNIYVR